MDLHTHPHVKSSSDDGVNKVAEPAATYPGDVPLMRPIRFKLWIFKCFSCDYFYGEVLVLWDVHHLDVIAVDHYHKDENERLHLPFLDPRAMSLSHQIDV